MSLAKNLERRASSVERPLHVGPYRLCLELASGGMATVYLAYNDGAGSAAARFAAVKLVHPHLAADGAFAEMFADEAEIASRIRHPNVCGVYDFEVSDGRSYIAMEYLLGESAGALWRKLARSRAADPKRNARLVAKALADACEGLHAAHELTDNQGEPLDVVHRDVSPGNVIVTFDGVTKVVDFGVAAAARKRHRTETGMLKGKLGYIAPESLRGQKADRRCDVWGVGVVAWELVTGQRLFRAASEVDTLRAVMDKTIPRPSEVRPELPSEIDDVIMLALQRDPDDRYETARDLGRDLARVASGSDVITAADLGEWLEQLFPGAKERRAQLLDIAAQIARGERDHAPVEQREPEREPTPPTLHSRPADGVRAPSVEEPTRVFDRAEPPPPRPRPAIARVWPGLAGVVLGVALGASTAWAIGRQAAPRAIAPPAAVPPSASLAAPPGEREPEPPPPPPPVRSELRLAAGAGLARGPYVLELVETTPDELLLRIRLDRAPEDVPFAEAEPATPARRALRIPRARP